MYFETFKTDVIVFIGYNNDTENIEGEIKGKNIWIIQSSR